jgi:hypothetical protein
VSGGRILVTVRAPERIAVTGLAYALGRELTMNDPDETGPGADPSFTAELATAFGWTAEEARRELGRWILSSEPGRLLQSSLRHDGRNPIDEAA